MSPRRGMPIRYANLLTISRSWSASVGAMLWPSTRATWKPKVTISVAYTAADASVLNHATSSSFHTFNRWRTSWAGSWSSAGVGYVTPAARTVGGSPYGIPDGSLNPG